MYRGPFWYLLPWITSIFLLVDALIIWEIADVPPFGTSSHPVAFVAGVGFIVALILLVQLIRETVSSRANQRKKS